MRYLIEKNLADVIEIITPSDPAESGSQLSLMVKLNPSDDPERGRHIFIEIENEGVTGDWRYPNVIRVAPVAQYNSFEDVYRFVDILKTAIENN
ncbi:MAG: hypothetical protein Q9M92_06090 [Enterobacterales bacterium]|nr:hypothetical protein [Enterobacterales bacterium]